MKRAIAGVVVLCAAGAVTGLAVAPAGAAKHRTTHFTGTSVGASVGGNRVVAVVHDPANGQGASVETIKTNGLQGSGRIITYWGTGTTTDVVSFTFTAPDSSGMSRLSGHGHQVGATGEFKGSQATFTISGTLNTKTTVSHVTIKGTVTT